MRSRLWARCAWGRGLDRGFVLLTPPPHSAISTSSRRSSSLVEGWTCYRLEGHLEGGLLAAANLAFRASFRAFVFFRRDIVVIKHVLQYLQTPFCLMGLDRDNLKGGLICDGMRREVSKVSDYIDSLAERLRDRFGEQCVDLLPIIRRLTNVH